MYSQHNEIYLNLIGKIEKGLIKDGKFQKDNRYYELTVRIIFELTVKTSIVVHSQHNKIDLNMID